MSALALAFERPGALGLLAVAALVLLVALRRPRARPLATGDLEPWREAAEQRGAAAVRAPRRAPPALLLAALACALAAVAVAGPRGEQPARRWIAVLDRSPGLYLDDGGTTRIERAVAAARALARRESAALAWCAAGDVAAPRDELPAAWLAAPRAPQPRDEAWDRDGVLWVTDRAPDPAPTRAGFVASGGRAVPGPVAVDGADLVVFDGERLQVRAGAAPARRVEVRGALDPRGPVGRALAAWCAARGVGGPERADGAVALTVHVATDGDARALRAGRDGWSADGTARGVAPRADADGALGTWLEAQGTPLVTQGPGRVHLAWLAEGAPAGDPAAFPVSFAELFDACALPPPGVVPLEARLAAGAPAERAPRDAETDRARPNTWIWAVGALLAALAALAARRAG